MTSQTRGTRINKSICITETGNGRINVTQRDVRAAILSVKVIGITYSEFVSVALVTQNAKRISRIANCGLPPPLHIFPHYLMNGMNFGEWENVIE
jgi:hypothetical protein